MTAPEHQQLHKYSKRVNAAQMVLYGIAVLCFVVVVLKIFFAFPVSTSSSTYSYFGLGLFYTALAIGSKGSPIVTLSIAAIINAIRCFMPIATVSLPSSSPLYVFLLFSYVVQVLITITLIIGLIAAINAKKITDKKPVSHPEK